MHHLGPEYVIVYHYTTPQAVPLIAKSGLRMSAPKIFRGRASGGGVYFSSLGPCSYGLGGPEHSATGELHAYQEALVKDCFGVHRMHEFKGTSKLAAVLVYALPASVLSVGRSSNELLVSHELLKDLSMTDGSPAKNYFLPASAVVGAFLIDPKRPMRFSAASGPAAQGEVAADRRSQARLQDAFLALEKNDDGAYDAANAVGSVSAQATLLQLAAEGEGEDDGDGFEDEAEKKDSGGKKASDAILNASKKDARQAAANKAFAAKLAPPSSSAGANAYAGSSPVRKPEATPPRGAAFSGKNRSPVKEPAPTTPTRGTNPKAGSILLSMAGAGKKDPIVPLSASAACSGTEGSARVLLDGGPGPVEPPSATLRAPSLSPTSSKSLSKAKSAAAAGDGRKGRLSKERSWRESSVEGRKGRLSKERSSRESSVEGDKAAAAAALASGATSGVPSTKAASTRAPSNSSSAAPSAASSSSPDQDGGNSSKGRGLFGSSRSKRGASQSQARPAQVTKGMVLQNVPIAKDKLETAPYVVAKIDKSSGVVTMKPYNEGGLAKTRFVTMKEVAALLEAENALKAVML